MPSWGGRAWAPASGRRLPPRPSHGSARDSRSTFPPVSPALGRHAGTAAGTPCPCLCYTSSLRAPSAGPAPQAHPGEPGQEPIARRIGSGSCPAVGAAPEALPGSAPGHMPVGRCLLPPMLAREQGAALQGLLPGYGESIARGWLPCLVVERPAPSLPPPEGSTARGLGAGVGGWCSPWSGDGGPGSVVVGEASCGLRRRSSEAALGRLRGPPDEAHIEGPYRPLPPARQPSSSPRCLRRIPYTITR